MKVICKDDSESMNILELYKLIEENTFQLDWEESEQEITCFSYLFQFESLTDGIKDYLDSLDEGVFKIELRHDYFVFRLKEICNYYEFEIADLAKLRLYIKKGIANG